MKQRDNDMGFCVQVNRNLSLHSKRTVAGKLRGMSKVGSSDETIATVAEREAGLITLHRSVLILYVVHIINV